MLHDLLRQQCIAAACLLKGEPQVLNLDTAGSWVWRPAAPAADERFPHIVLLFAEPDRADPLAAGTAGLAEVWALRPIRLIELAGCEADAGLAVRLLEAQPILYDLLPARLLLPGKKDDDPLFAAEVNGLARAAGLAGSVRRFAEVAAIAPAKAGTPPQWQYRSWRSAAAVTVALHDEPRPPLWTYLDPIVLRISGELKPPGARWRSRLEQFRAPG